LAQVSSIIRRRCAPKLSNKIIQKGLAFAGHWSGTDVSSGSTECSGDPAPPACRPRRGVGGAARGRDEPIGGSNVKVREKALGQVNSGASNRREAAATVQ
jgi:hypothetical protein